MSAVILQSFDSADGPGVEALPGYAEGLAAGLARREAEDAATLSDCLQLLSDLRFTHAEAQRIVLAQIRPLIDTVLSRILPPMAGATLPAHLQTMLYEAAQAAATGPLTMRVAPAQAAALSSALEATDLQLHILPDPSLAPLAARLTGDDGDTLIDLTALIDRLVAETDAFFSLAAEERQHG